MQIPKLRRHRERRALTQEELAEKAGISVRSVAGYETGAGARPGSVRKLAAALDIKVEELLEEEAPKVEAPLSFEDDDQWRSAFLESWTSYTLKRAQEWGEALPEGAREAAKTFGGFEKLFAAKPGLALETMHRNERVQAEAAMLFRGVERVVDDAQRYGDFRGPTDADFARWREERVGRNEWIARLASGGRADLKELVATWLRAHEAAEKWMHVARAAGHAAVRETEHRAELEPSTEIEQAWEKVERYAEERQNVVALFEERMSA